MLMTDYGWSVLVAEIVYMDDESWIMIVYYGWDVFTDDSWIDGLLGL